MTQPGPTGAGTRRALAQNTGLLLAASVLRNGTVVAILALLAQFTTQATVGQYSLAVAIATPTFVVAQLGLRSIVLTHVHRFTFGTYARLQLGFVALAALVTLGIIGVVQPSLLLIAALVCVMKAGDAVTELCSGVLQLQHRTTALFVGGLVYAALAITATAVALAATGSIEIALTIVAFVSVVTTLLFIVLPAARADAADGSAIDAKGAPAFRAILIAGVPLGTTNALASLVLSIPQFVVAASLGDAAVGHLAAIVYAYAIADLVLGSASQAWITSARTALRALPREQRRILPMTVKVTGFWLLAMIPLSVIGVVLVAVCFPIVFGPDYAIDLESGIALGVAVLVLPVSHFAGSAALVRNLYVHGLAFAIAGIIAVLIASFILVPIAGLAGALWSIAAAAIVRGGVAFAVLARNDRLPTGPEDDTDA